MLPAFSDSITVFPELRVLPERLGYDVWSKYEDGFILVKKDGELYRNRFICINRWLPHQWELLRTVSRDAWITMIKAASSQLVINGYEVVDIFFHRLMSQDWINITNQYRALKFRMFVEK